MSKTNYHPVIIVCSQLVSAVFHPFFVLSYAFLLLAWSNPYLFGHNSFDRVLSGDATGQQYVFINIVMFTVTVPLFGIVLMRGLKLIQNVALTDRQDRTGPFILTGLFYLMMYMTINRAPSVPHEYKVFLLGGTIALFMAFFINLFSKISVHTVGMGNLLAIVLMTITRSYANNDYIFIIAIIACGAVATARRILTDREPSDIYGGFFVGFFAQFVALSFLPE